MSFGLHDKDWVDPVDEDDPPCHACARFVECECGCEYGWCKRHEEFIHRDTTGDCGWFQWS